MARKPNYDYEKRRKELDRKKKQEEKRQRKRENAADRQADGTAEDTTEQPLTDDDTAATPQE